MPSTKAASKPATGTAAKPPSQATLSPAHKQGARRGASHVDHRRSLSFRHRRTATTRPPSVERGAASSTAGRVCPIQIDHRRGETPRGPRGARPPDPPRSHERHNPDGSASRPRSSRSPSGSATTTASTTTCARGRSDGDGTEESRHRPHGDARTAGGLAYADR